MFFKSPRHRRFQYTPQYTASDREERLKFSAKTRYHRYGGARNPWFYFLLAAAFFLIYLYIRGGLSLKPKIDQVSIKAEDASSATTETSDR